MEVIFLQHIYTSSKALRGYYSFCYSPGIKEEEIEELKKIGHYNKPDSDEFPALPEKEELIKFPIKFCSYTLNSTGKVVFSRSVYIGRDRHSRSPRAGNYISHAFMRKDRLSYPLSIPQVYNKLPWLTEIDDEMDIGGNTGAMMASKSQIFYNSTPSEYLTKDLIEFLFEDRKKRLRHLANLIQFIISNIKDQREDNQWRVVIIDDGSELHKWILVLFLVFPDKLSSLISFCSYTYDPDTCQANIIGTVKDYFLPIENPRPNTFVFDIKNKEKLNIVNPYCIQIIKKIELFINDSSKAKNDLDDLLKEANQFCNKGRSILDLAEPIVKIEDFEKIENKEFQSEIDVKNIYDKYPLIISEFKEKALQSENHELYKNFILHDLKSRNYEGRGIENFKGDLTKSKIFHQRFGDLMWKHFNIHHPEMVMEVIKFGEIGDREFLGKLFQDVLNEKVKYGSLLTETSISIISKLKEISEIVFNDIKSKDKDKWEVQDSLSKLNLSKGNLIEILPPLNQLFQLYPKLAEYDQTGYLEEAKAVLSNVDDDWIKVIFSENVDLELVKSILKSFSKIEEINVYKYSSRSQILTNSIKSMLGLNSTIDNLIKLKDLEVGQNYFNNFKKLANPQQEEIIKQVDSKSRIFLYSNLFQENFIEDNSPIKTITDFEQEKGIENLKYLDKEIFERLMDKYKSESKFSFYCRLVRKYSDYLNYNFFELLSNYIISYIDEYPTAEYNDILEVIKKQRPAINIPILEYKERLENLKFLEKENAFLGFASIVKDIKKEKTEFKVLLVSDGLKKIVKSPFDYYDWMVILKILDTQKISDELIIDSVQKFLDNYQKDKPNLKWLNSNFILAVIFRKDEKKFDNMIENQKIIITYMNPQTKSDYAKMSEHIQFVVENILGEENKFLIKFKEAISLNRNDYLGYIKNPSRIIKRMWK